MKFTDSLKTLKTQEIGAGLVFPASEGEEGAKIKEVLPPGEELWQQGGGPWGVPGNSPAPPPPTRWTLQRMENRQGPQTGVCAGGGGPNREGPCLRLQIKYNTGDRQKITSCLLRNSILLGDLYFYLPNLAAPFLTPHFPGESERPSLRLKREREARKGHRT